MKIQDVEIRIKVGETYLEEYDVRYDGDGGNRRGVCYIASEAGKNFTIEHENCCSDQAFGCVLHIDGVMSTKYTLRNSTSRSISSQRTNDTTRRLFMFAELHVTDDDSAVTADQEQRMIEEMGTFRLSLFRITSISVRHKPSSHRTHRGTVPIVLHEKTKKAGSHIIQLGEEQHVPRGENRPVAKYLDSTKGAPFMSFTFRYRPKEMLQAQGIIPVDNPRSLVCGEKRPGPNEAGPSKRPRAEDDPSRVDTVVPKQESEAIQALLAERAALDARIQEARGLEEVKRELSPINLRVANGTVIDLTLD